MPRILLLIGLCLLGLSEAEAQAPPAAPGLTVHLYGGATDHALGGATDFWRDVIGAYREAGVPVPEQRMYPATYVTGAEVLLPLRPGVRFGVGVQWSQTWATSLYGDYAGTLDLRSRVHMLAADAVSTFDLTASGRLRPFLGARGGPLLGLYRIEEAVALDEIDASTSTTRGSAVGFSVEGFGGARYALGRVALQVQVGYRYGRTNAVGATIRQDGAEEGSGELPFRLGFAGPVARIGLDLRLW